jgi:cytoskeletal protein CcmA (bactofilin family)
MFKRRKAPMTADVETLIGPGTRVDGNLLVSAGVHLEGQVRGNVSAPDEGGAWLFVAERGVVEGQVDVPRVIVHGEVRGDIRAIAKVELGPRAKIAGNVHYGLIEMAAGALIQGRLMAIPPGAERASPPTRTGEGAEGGRFDPSGGRD